MTVKEFFDFIRDNGSTIGGWIVAVSIFIEITPVKINPWGTLIAWIGKRINKSLREELADTTKVHLKNYDELVKKVDAISKKQESLEQKEAYREAMTSRYRIIRAADEIRNGEQLSDEHLEQLGEDIEIYDTFCDNHPDYKNHKGQKSKAMVLAYEDQQLAKVGCNE